MKFVNYLNDRLKGMKRSEKADLEAKICNLNEDDWDGLQALFADYNFVGNGYTSEDTKKLVWDASFFVDSNLLLSS